MHLSVTCPRCETKFQLDEGMRGKRMRCPNSICRAVFEVRDDNDPLPAQSSPPAPREETVAPSAAATVEQPDRTRAPREEEPVKRKPVPKPIEPAPDFPDDFPGDDEAAPAPAASAVATEAWQPETPAMREAAPPSAAPPPRKRRKALGVIGAMLLALGAIAAIGYWRVLGTMEASEAKRFHKAETLYHQREFAEASAALQRLYRDFPESAHNKKYRFLGELSDVRGAVHAPRETPDEAVRALERLLQFAGVYRGDPLLNEHASDVEESLAFLADQLTRLAEQEQAPAYLPLAKRAWTEARKYPPPAGTNQAERERRLADDWTRIDALLTAHLERLQVIATFKKLRATPTAAAVQEAWTLAEKTKRLADAEIRALLTDLQTAQRERVVFVPADPASEPRALDADALASLFVTPSVQVERDVQASEPVLALARGVIYALDPANGAVRWARRVGIDTNVLPPRVPADAITPELVLALSSDQRSIAAVVLATGATLWQTRLEDACLGAPVLIDGVALVPTLAGQIEEIEIAEGRRLGVYEVGQPLLLGGVRRPGTPFAYFPADEFCLYEFDVTKRICTSILYTRHAAGALLGLPAVYALDKEGWLLTCEATGLDRAAVKTYRLPIGSAEQKPAHVADLPGRSAPPWFGADRWAAMTPTGFLSAWGVRLPGTRDPLLFRQLKDDFPVDEGKGGRCEIVHADSYNYWTMTRGRLQRVQAIFDASKGPDFIASWTRPLKLGTLLHAAQVRKEPNGRPILFLTTQALDRPVCLASAVDAETGKLIWQRQLGVMPQQPLAAQGGQILLRDADGVLRFDPMPYDGKARWAEAGEWLHRQSTPGEHQVLLVRENAYVLATSTSNGMKMRVTVGVVAGTEKPRAFDITLPGVLQGDPALGDGYLLLPLANGILARVNLQDGALLNGPDWRAAGAEEQARGHIAFLDANEFVITDGSRGLARIVSSDGKFWDRRAAHQLSHRIVATPVLVPASDGKARLCLRDASDTLTLLDAERLTHVRRWTIPGKVTAGPFVRGGKIGCVVGRTRLVWLDPDKDAPAWEYAFVADIVGESNVIDGVLVVGDAAGQFLALDPASGRPLGAGLTLKANVAPTAAPLPFGEGRAFVPLTDGTVLLLPLDKLR